MPDSALDSIFKAYDVRGIYPDEIDESIARRVGNAFVAFTGAARVLVGRDARPSSEPLVAAFTEGALVAGADVVDLGLASTDLCYFAAGSLDAPGRDVHRQPQPGRVQRHEAVPGRRRAHRAGHRPGRDQGDGRRRAARAGRGPGPGRAARPAARVRRPRPLVRRPRRAARRCGSSPTPPTASAASSCPRCSPACRWSCRVLFGELDGTFPNHPADPTNVENLKDLQRPSSTPTPTSASRSTATPTASSSSTTRPSRCRAPPPPRSLAAAILDRNPGRDRWCTT